MGEIALLDLAYKEVETPYVLVSFTTEIYTQKGFIEEAILKMSKDTKISQVIFKNFDGATSDNIIILENSLAGFSFNPGLTKLSLYKRLG